MCCKSLMFKQNYLVIGFIQTVKPVWSTELSDLSTIITRNIGFVEQHAEPFLLCTTPLFS